MNKNWHDYVSRSPRVLRLELGATYGELFAATELNDFARPLFEEGTDLRICMAPWSQPNGGPVIVSYGIPHSIFELPASTFVLVEFLAGHVLRVDVKPMLYPSQSADALRRAKEVIELLDGSRLKRLYDRTITLTEVQLRMRLLAEDMDRTRFVVGEWEREESHGTARFNLVVDVIQDHSVKEPASQYYGVELHVWSDGLYDRLEKLKRDARVRFGLSHEGKPGSLDAHGYEVLDVGEYLNRMRAVGLIPL